MTQFLLGLVLFLGMHSMSIVALPLRDRLAGKSEVGWKLIYSVASLIGIILVARGYADLRQSTTVIYESPIWMRHVAAIVLLPVFVLFFPPIFPERSRTPSVIHSLLPSNFGPWRICWSTAP